MSPRLCAAVTRGSRDPGSLVAAALAAVTSFVVGSATV